MCQMSVKQADDCNLLVVSMGAWLIYFIRAVLFGVSMPDDGGLHVKIALSLLGVVTQWVLFCVVCMKLNGSRSIDVLGVRWFRQTHNFLCCGHEGVFVSSLCPIRGSQPWWVCVFLLYV